MEECFAPEYRAVRTAYMETGLPRVDPTARGGGGGGGGGGGSGAGYDRMPVVAHTKLEARRHGAGAGGGAAAAEMVSHGCGPTATARHVI